MKISQKHLIALVSSFFIFFKAGILLAESNMADHNHGHVNQAVSGLSLNKGEKWKTDDALRQGMHRINDAAMKAVPAFHHDTMTKTDAVKLAKQINDQVSYIVTNCSLQLEADVMLHVLIGDLLTATAKLSDEPLSGQGLPVIVKTIQQYPVFFDHPGWNVFKRE